MDCMDCFVGASTGALKGVSFRDGAFKNVNSVRTLKPTSDEITSMCWSGQDQAALLTAQMDRQLKIYDSVNNTYTSMFKLEGGNGAVKGIHAPNNGSIVSAVESGELRIWKSTGEMVSELNAGNNLLVMVGNDAVEGQYATGGRENPLKVWDVQCGQKIFTAKNVRPDSLQLRVPIWDTDIRFLPDSQNIVTTTGKYQIRVYDPRAQRRPVKEMEWLKEPLTAMSLCSSPMHIIAGNTRGEMGLFDLRNKMHMVCKLKGFAGSVRGIDAHSSAPYVASCSIDRFVRLHDMTTKKVIKKVYCKARLNKILVRNNLSIVNNQAVKKEELDNYEEDWKKIQAGGDADITDSDDASTSGEDEALWNDMRESVELKSKRKRVLFDEDEKTALTKKERLESRIKRKREKENNQEEGSFGSSAKKGKAEEHGEREHETENDSAVIERTKRGELKKLKRSGNGANNDEILPKRFHCATELNV
ncbi:WD repeat-containing protein 74 [Toxocara canis]|uniref:WD repeat-containing protein 74 n=1 Tax=Toxocara canis TaxID=6265 RepID=A0A0B2VAD7_TOXCA|nr:WD repeat-containing protein 74 [Toxocara canis]